MTGEDLKQLRQKKGITQEELSVATGIPKGTIGRIEYNKSQPVKKVNVLTTLSNFFKNDSPLMDVSAGVNQEEHHEQEIPTDFMEKIKLLLNKGGNVDLTAVYDRHVTSGSVSKVQERGLRPHAILVDGDMKDCDLVIRHTDPAMDGFVAKKSFIGLKRITKQSYTRRIIPGKAYVIVMDDYVIERFVHPGKEGHLLLRSRNPLEGPEFEIGVDEIVELWLIKAWIPVFEAEPV